MNADRPVRLGWRLLACAALVLPLLIAAPAAAEEEDELTFEERFIRNLFGGGRPPIEYRERSPLVIPPGAELPSPEAGTAAPSASWPRDPDQARRQRAARSANAPAIDVIQQADQPLSPAELRRGARARARAAEPAPTINESTLGNPLTPAQLGETRSLFGLVGRAVIPEKPATFTGEPPRTRLTQPPTGYQTPASGQPYTPPSRGGIFPEVPNIFDRTTPVAR
jgi:hypothetical protein